MEPKLEEVQSALLKPYNYTRKKLYPLFKGLSEKEKELVCSQDDVLNHFFKVEDDEILAMLFRMCPAKIQERIWEQDDCQRRLFGIRNLDIQDKRALNEKIYFSKDRMRRIDIFIGEIKSESILHNLCSNVYFQIIVLFAKGLSKKTLERVDCLALYESTIASGVYDLANNHHKQRWISLLNGFFEELKLPEDFHAVYKTTRKSEYYHTTEDDTVILMLRSKDYHLQERGQHLRISK